MASESWHRSPLNTRGLLTTPDGQKALGISWMSPTKRAPWLGSAISSATRNLRSRLGASSFGGFCRQEEGSNRQKRRGEGAVQPCHMTPLGFCCSSRSRYLVACGSFWWSFVLPRRTNAVCEGYRCKPRPVCQDLSRTSFWGLSTSSLTPIGTKAQPWICQPAC